MMALDVVEAKLHWNLSRYAYRDAVGARRAVEGLDEGLELVWGKFYDSGGSTQAFTCGDGSRMIVAFRGSEEV